MTTTPGKPPHVATVDEVLALIVAQVPGLDTESVSLADGSGRVLRETVRALEDQPPFDRSAMDGYSIRLDDPATRFRIIESIRAGDWKPLQLERGQAVQVATGAALPAEGLQVVMKEDVQVEGNEIVLLRRGTERNIRFRGEDARVGTELLAAGTILGPGALALLASIGQVRPLVVRQPRAVHLVTGNEMVPPEQTPPRGGIRDSNSTLVQAFLGQWNIPVSRFRVPEDERPVRKALEDHCAVGSAPDLLLVSGGASVGEHDFTRSLLEELGFTIHVNRTTTRPGKPLIFATRDGVVAFGLPGNPLAHFVCLNLYVRAALRRLCGQPARPAFCPGTLTHEFRAEANARETLWPARLTLAGGNAELALLPWRSSGDLTSLATANALVRIPSGCGTLRPGSTVQFAGTTPLP